MASYIIYWATSPPGFLLLLMSKIVNGDEDFGTRCKILHTSWNIFRVTNIRFSSSLFFSGFTYGCRQDTIFDSGKSIAKKEICPPF